MNKSVEKKLISYFEPMIIPTTAAKYVTNVSCMPDDKEITSYLTCILLPNYKCICNNFTISKIPEVIMDIIKEYLVVEPLATIKKVKMYWFNIYIKKLDSMREEDEFDLMYYGPGEIDYNWSYRRLNMIKSDIDYINNKKKAAEEKYQ